MITTDDVSESIVGCAIEGVGMKIKKSPIKNRIDIDGLFKEYCHGYEDRSKWITEADRNPANWETKDGKDNWNINEDRILSFISWVADRVLEGRVPTSAICTSPDISLDFHPEYDGCDNFYFVNRARSAKWGVAIAWCQRELKRQLIHQIDHIRFPNQKNKYKQHEGHYNAQWRGLVYGINSIRGIIADVWDARQRLMNKEVVEMLCTEKVRLGMDVGTNGVDKWREDLRHYDDHINNLRNLYYNDRNTNWPLIKRGIQGCMEYDGHVVPMARETYEKRYYWCDESYVEYLKQHMWRKVLMRTFTKHEAEFRRRERDNEVFIRTNNKRKCPSYSVEFEMSDLGRVCHSKRFCDGRENRRI